jgi:hypothetical protein
MSGGGTHLCLRGTTYHDVSCPRGTTCGNTSSPGGLPMATCGPGGPPVGGTITCMIGLAYPSAGISRLIQPHAMI